ncbi:hypothetical protein Tco_1156946 [Tanacetum coccineum]
MEGLTSNDELSNDGWRRWESHEITYHDHDEIKYENETHRQELCEIHELFNNHELPVCTIRRFEMIKYSFGKDEEYVAVKEDEYDDLARTSKDACQAYQEIFRMMDEGWMVTRAEPGASSKAVLPASVRGKGRSKKNGMRLTEQTLECLPHLGKILSHKVKIAREDIGRRGQKIKSLALLKATYPNLGYVKKRIHLILRSLGYGLMNSPRKYRQLCGTTESIPDPGNGYHEIQGPSPMSSSIENQNKKKFCEFHRDKGHNTNECIHLKKQIKEARKSIHLVHLVNEIKQGNSKRGDHTKAAKKGESAEKEKAPAIFMVQTWKRVTRKKLKAFLQT